MSEEEDDQETPSGTWTAINWLPKPLGCERSFVRPGSEGTRLRTSSLGWMTGMTVEEAIERILSTEE
jgi:hypothetical protein